jgi:hypothetical protein
MDARKLKMYKLAIKMNKMTIEDVPSPYKEAIESGE